MQNPHDDVIKCKHFPRYCPFVWGIHRSPVNSPHKGQWRGALMFSLICVWINGWGNNCEAGDLRRHYADYDVTVIIHEKTKITQYNMIEMFLNFCSYAPKMAIFKIDVLTDIFRMYWEQSWCVCLKTWSRQHFNRFFYKLVRVFVYVVAAL